MRIISGRLGGRKIHPPSNMPYTRPTTDIAKSGLFNTLQHMMDINGAHTLDLFAGTGSISYELYSRGAEKLTLIEQDSKMYAFILSMIQTLNADQNMQVLRQEVFRFLMHGEGKYDFIFAGPPYALNTIDDIPDIIINKSLLKPDGIFVLEHTPRNDYTQHHHFYKLKQYGTTIFSFFRTTPHL